MGAKGQQIPEEVRRFAARLEFAMKLRNVGNNELERRAGLVNSETGKGTGHVSRLLACERGLPQWATAKAISDALGIRTAWLLEGEDPMDLPRAISTQLRAARSALWPDWATAELKTCTDSESAQRTRRGPKNNSNFWAAVLVLAREETADPQPPDFDEIWIERRADEWLEHHDLHNRPRDWRNLVRIGESRWRELASSRRASIKRPIAAARKSCPT